MAEFANEAAVIDQLCQAGMPDPVRLSTHGRIVRYGPQKRAWYSLHELRTRSGAVVIAGTFGYWGRIESTRLQIDWQSIGKADLEDLRRRAHEADAQQRLQRDRCARMAAMQARELLSTATREGKSPYLDRKQVVPEAIRYLPDGAIVVPMFRYDLPRPDRLVGCQTIRPDGCKRFTPGTAKRGAACRLGEAGDTGPLFLCEGLATGLSIRMATGKRWAVFVAFDCGNLAPVGEILRTLFPDKYLLFCADDDRHTRGNPGRDKAMTAAAAAGNADIIYPAFIPGATLTDFNDLHVAAGLAELRRQLDRALLIAREHGRLA